MSWLKSFHLVFIVTWFAGLFYLPRLFVYHSQVDLENDRISDKRFQVMERKLFWGIMTPGAMLTILSGVWLMLLSWEAYVQQAWLAVKLALVLALIFYHGWCGKLVADFAKQANRHNHVWYRWFNEVPTLSLVAIILLAVVKPWQ